VDPEATELVPRTRLLSTPYARQARGAEMAHVFQLVPQDTPPDPEGDCDAGSIYFDVVMNEPCYCTGTNWVQMDGGGPCDCPDLDGDGYDICHVGHPKDTDDLPADCDDTDPGINPGEPEIQCNGIDENCSGMDDDGTIDFDGDGVSLCDGDCDEFNPDVYPGAPEFCDGMDNDCDGTLDEDAIDAQAWYEDADGDGWGGAVTMVTCVPPFGWVPNSGDCDESNNSIFPGAIEVCDGLDNDCNGTVDDNAIGAVTWYQDLDADGYGSNVSVVACSPPPGTWVQNNLDCNDFNNTVNPGASEFCGNGIDDDCDGFVDEGCP